MQAQQQSFTPVKNGAPPDVESTSQTKKAVQGAEGYDAQAARLAPQEGTIPSSGGKAATAGPALIAVQNKLNALGFECGKADGIMGPKTRGAIVAFQTAKGIAPTGTADDATITALNGQNNATPPGGAKTADHTPASVSGGGAAAVIGNGPQLKAAQEKLNSLGYSAGVPDGLMGPKTKGALQAFQAAKGLSATGTLDTNTLDKLDELAAKTPVAPAPMTATPSGQAADADKKADDKQSPTPQGPGTPISGARQAVAAAAFAEVGKVRAKDTTGKDDEGKSARVGWDRLAEYFNVSLGGAWKDQELLKRPRKGTKLKHGTTTGETVETSDTLPSWCGIFAIWAVKSAGFSIGTWGIGKSAPNIMKGRNKVPQVGDVVVMANNNHHAVVVWVAPDAAEKAAAGKLNSIEIKTVDGNSGSNPVSGGEVVDKGSSTMAKWDYGAWSPE